MHPQSTPSAVRRWWWGTSQRTRLATACLGTAAGMAACFLVLAPFQTEPYLRAIGLMDDPAPRPADTRTLSAGAVITIVSVTSVDVFDGKDAENQRVALRVPGIRSAPPCWASQALDDAEELLRGKQVALADIGDADSGGRVAARVQLPDGRDYAQAVVSAGAAQAVDDDLTAAQAAAREGHRGLWGAACPVGKPVDPNAPPAPTATLTPTPTPAPTQTSPHPPPSTTAIPTPTTTPPDDVQQNVRRGTACSPEGARGMTNRGVFLVCTMTSDGTTKWKKA